MRRFFRILREAKLDWRINDMDAIILKTNGSVCPWLAVNNISPIAAGDEKVDSHEIWAAADKLPGHNRHLRRRLKQACGLGK